MDEVTAMEAPIPSVRLEIDALQDVNFALQQNGIGIVRSLNIVNESAEVLEDVTLSITTTPQISLPFHRQFARIPGESTFRAGSLDIVLWGEELAALTEKISCTLQFRLTREGQVLCSEDLPVTVLAYDEWHGIRSCPELLCAFVMPNHPQIPQLTARASELLEKWTSDPSLDGYQTQDPNRVLSQAAAVYGALQEQNIVYCVPPASFEPAGQRVRLCDAVLQQKMGTCLDLSLLYSSCLEAIGLHSVLILKKGHIFCGVWLEELTFPECVQDDVSLITKRLADGVNEMAVVECTAFTAGKEMSFDQASAAAARQLTDIEYILDVKRARLSGVAPLPVRVQTEQGWQIIRPKVKEKDLTVAPTAVEALDLSAAEADTPSGKRVQGERKLLDLGLRNALISMRMTGSIVPVLTDSVDKLENALNSGKDFSILPRPADYAPEGKPDFDTMHELRGCEELVASEFENRRLRSVYTDTELSKSLKNLYRTAKTSLEENGANTLYLALGLLKWYESERSTKPRFAPVMLLPVEMVRKNASQGYVIRLRDDDPQMNITILEKLKQDFHIQVNGLDPLPMDEQGIDTRKVFTILRKAIMEQPKWDVLESAYLGIFSFSQFVMWNDIRNRSEDLERNKIVRSLMDGRLAWEAEEMNPEEPSDARVFLPMSADASQLFAIASAARGESFVLHGPPGTGKSQTITTMIANALAQGKSVLFVAEKMAALEVVQKRLEKIGIGPFCLELHSNKAKKRTVLEQLRRATEVTRDTSAEEYAARADQLAQLRAELDCYADALHTPLTCGKDLYALVSLYEENKQAPDLPPLDKAFVRSLSAESLREQETLIERMIAIGKVIEHPNNHPLEPVRCCQYSQQLRYELPQAVGELRTAAKELSAALDSLALPQEAGRDLSGLQKTAQVTSELKQWTALPKNWSALKAPRPVLIAMSQMAQNGIRLENNLQILQASWTEGFFQLDGKELCTQWDSVAGKWFLPKMSTRNEIIRTVKPYAKGAVDKNTLRKHLGQLANYQSLRANVAAQLDTLGPALGNLYNGTSTDYNLVLRCAQQAITSEEKLEALGASELRSVCAQDPQVGQKLENLDGLWAKFHSAKDTLYQLLDIAEDTDAEDHLSWQLTLCHALTDYADMLKDWIAFNALCQEARQLGIGFVADSYRAGISHDMLPKAYRKAVYQALAVEAIDNSEALNSFSGVVFNEKIRQFKRLDEEVTKLTQQEIYCRLASRVPNFAKEAAQSSELGILQRAIRSGGRGLSLRKLFEQLPNLLPRLCPCMLMSPISAAQYLEPGRKPFDLVVFDEASQLPTAKAVGALARGTDAVIVGDPRQMPPTAFFVSSSADEENLEAEDLESILDDCLAMSIPQTHLLWHYRSRHESLIAYSNSRFYENKLYTFPSVNDRASKVSLVHVDGVFERGKQRQNRAEAEAVVEELKHRCHDEELKKLSVGVVTFNISQQHLIDDLLSEACRDDAELDAWAYQSEEPVFIKNLENVQGDERDVILFSIGYGPDEKGKVFMNFGPLNRDGGWRRLNVAITRARQEMIVFATLRPEQIDLSRTSAEGVIALKGFLEYAQNHRLSVDENAIVPDDALMGIARSVCAFLKENGYDTDCQVGHSKYRMDIGVIDPKNPESYCLGILLDGESYANAKLTRDREIAQISVLNGLGWRTTRIWTMDWWDNSSRELERILSLLQSPEKPEEPEQTETAALPEPVLAQAVQAAPKAMDENREYQIAELSQSTVLAEDLTDGRYAAAIRKKITAVLDREAPISRSLLTRRVVQSYGIARSGSRIQSYLDAIYRSMKLQTTEQMDQLFYWLPSQDPETYFEFRIGSSEEVRRDAKEVPVQEAAAAVCQVLREQISLGSEDLVRESAKLMGYSRLGTAVTMLFMEGIRYAQWKKRITTDVKGKYILAEQEQALLSE